MAMRYRNTAAAEDINMDTLLPQFHTLRRAQTLPISFDLYTHNNQTAPTRSQRVKQKLFAYIVKNHLEFIKMAVATIGIIVTYNK
jgi:hypothetical protein